MKVRSSLRGLKRKVNSIVVRRRGKVFVINKADPRQKARQGGATPTPAGYKVPAPAETG
ncbi:ribosomal protein L36 [Micromonospora kangleipakensis]|uniref:Large ribosomal subunit protein bL36 n=2 Tax=Micromonospora TaxID=1873 RepID=A0A4Q8BDK5_9ACTN|nr:ribosomal protein L36 [Micromonospora kangleipakensis]